MSARLITAFDAIYRTAVDGKASTTTTTTSHAIMTVRTRAPRLPRIFSRRLYHTMRARKGRSHGRLCFGGGDDG